MTWPAIVGWILILIGLLPRSPLFLLYLFFAFGAFMSLNMLGASSVNLVPQSACAVFLVCKVLLSKGQLSRAVDAAIDPARLGLLFAFLLYALFSAYVMPRLFAHMVETVSMNTEVQWATLLEPTSANISQSGYMTASAGIALIFALSGEDSLFRRHYLRAFLAGCFVLIGTGVLDMGMAAAGLGSLLEPFRNAYALLVDVEVMGSKRVVGLMPEASSYGTACVAALGYLVFLRPCFANPLLRNWLVPLAILGLLAMAALSTSSAAYVGLAVFGVVFAANWLRRAFSPDAPARNQLKWEAAIAFTGAITLLAVLTFVPHAMDPVNEMIDALVFKKSESSSYEERSMWTRVALQAFFATDGLGVGLGSARTSNWFVAILSNTGIIGAALLGGFILRLFVRRCLSADPQSRELVAALKFGMVPQFAMSALVGTTPDIGAGLASAMGMIASLTPANAIAPAEPRARAANQGRLRNGPASR
jgi:hypothetical protein